RAFGFNMGDFVSEARERYDFERQFAAFTSELEETDVSITDKIKLNFSMARSNFGTGAPQAKATLTTESGYSVTAGFEANIDTAFGLAAEGATSATQQALGDSFSSPLFGFAADGVGAAAAAPLGEKTAISFGFMQGDSAAPDSDAEAFAAIAEVKRRIGERSSVSLSISGLVEESTVLGGETSGALAMEDGAPTQFVGVSAQVGLTDSVSLVGAYHAGVTFARPADGSLYSDIDPILSDSFSAGVRYDDDGRWGLLSVSQPLRVAAGQASLDTPSEQRADGSLVYERQTVDLAPNAREIDLQLSGGAKTTWGGFTLGAAARFNPNHDRDAETEGVAFFKTKISF
ncbi:MAG: hypothetical protein AAF684_06895, partial [Pseudomonadota bacterium]